MGFDDRATALVGEQVHRMGGMVPQQVVGPTARLTQRVHVGAAEKIGLYVHLLDVEIASLDFLMNPLVAGIEASGVATHGDQARGLLQVHHLLTVFEDIAQGDLDLHVLAGLEAVERLTGVHLSRRAQDHSVEFLDLEGLGQIGGDVTNPVLGGDFPGFVQLTANERDHLNPIDVLNAIEMLDAKCAGTGEGDFDGFTHGVTFKCFPK